MEELFALFCTGTAMLVLSLVVVAPVALFIWLAVRIQSLERRLTVLTQRIEGPTAEPLATPPAPIPQAVPEEDFEVPEWPPLPEEDEPPGPSSEPDPPREPKPPFVFPSPERIAVALGASVGAFALLIGALLGLVAVLEAGFFGPGLRIGGGLVAGTVLWVFAAAMRGRVRILPSALAGTGMGILLGSLFAAHSFYDLIGPLPTFGLLVGVSAVAALRAAVHRDRFMAHLGLVGALMAPLLVSTGNNGAVGLFTYLFLVLCGTSAVAAKRRWPDLLITSALGSAAIYLGWTSVWRGLDSSVIALVAATAMALPLASSSLVRDENKTLEVVFRACAVLSASLFLLVALPWVLPIEAAFRDPRNGLEVLQSQGWLREIQAVGLALLPLPLWLAARLRRDALTASVPTVLSLGLTLAWVAGWGEHSRVADPVFVFATLGPLVVMGGLFVGARRAGEPAAALLIPPAMALLVGLGIGIDGELFTAAVVLWTLAATAMALTSASGSMLLVAAPLIAGVLAISAHQLEGPLWTVGPALVALGALTGVGLLRTWRKDRVPALGWAGALLIAPLLFPALHTSWTAAMGWTFVGVLPLLLGTHGLLGAAILLRGHGVKRAHPALILAVMVALGGVTFALPVQFQERWLTVGWALESAALAILATRLKHPLVRWTAVILGLVVGVRLLLNPWALGYGDASGWPILNWTLYTWGVPTAAFLIGAWFVQRSKPEGTDWLRWAPTALRVVAMGTGFALVNVEVSQAFQSAGPLELSSATMIQGMVRSLSWGSWGLFLLVVGLVVRSRYTRFVGFSFLMLAAAKVFVYDIWSLPGFVRVGSLLGLGFILIVSAFLFERLVLRESTHPPQGAP